MKITIEGKKLKYDFNLVNASRDEHLFSAYVVAYGAWTRRGLSIPVNYRSWLGSQNAEEVREYVLPITDDEALILEACFKAVCTDESLAELKRLTVDFGHDCADALTVRRLRWAYRRSHKRFSLCALIHDKKKLVSGAQGMLGILIGV